MSDARAPAPVSPLIHGVVVTFEPEAARLTQVVQALAPQVHKLLVVDNSQSPESQERVREIVADLARNIRNDKDRHNHDIKQPRKQPDIQLHCSDANIGLSRAYNVAVADARAGGAEYLLLLDQDSVVAADMVDALVSGIQLGKQQASTLGVSGAPAMVGPWYTDELTGRRSVIIRTNRFGVGYVRLPQSTAASEASDEMKQTVVPTEMLISSGSLVAMPVFDELGELDPELFIDHVDTDWCLRIRHSGQWMAMVPGAHMSHQLGDRALRLWWGRWRLLPVHSPIRLYYTFRNSLWLYVRPHAHWRWILFDLKRLCAVTLIHALAGGPRWPRVKMIVKGLGDGLRGPNRHRA